MNSMVNPSAHAEVVETQLSRSLLVGVAILSLAGMIVSSISLQRHYAKSATSYCEFGEKFNCDIVNRSEYSSVMGIPVSLIGIAGYGLLLTLSILRRSRPETATRLLMAAAAGLVFALYLTYIEAYVLTTWCILCLTSLALIASITALAGVLKFGLATNS
jgi:uncharacterized membrane protein